MREFLLYATSSVGFALIACLVVTIAWLVLRSAGPRYARTAHDLLVVLSVITILVLTLRPGDLNRLRSPWELMPFDELLGDLGSRCRGRSSRTRRRRDEHHAVRAAGRVDRPTVARSFGAPRDPVSGRVLDRDRGDAGTHGVGADRPAH